MKFTWIAPNPNPHRRRWRVWFKGIDGKKQVRAWDTEGEARAWIDENQKNVVRDGRAVEEAVGEWLASLDVAESTRTTLKYRIGALTVGRVGTLLDTFPWQLAWAEGPAKQSRASQVGILAATKSLLSFAGVPVAVLGGVKPRGEVKRGKDQLGVDQARKFIGTALAAGDDLAHAAAVQILCGLRSGEVLGLKVADVDDGGHLLRVRGTKTAAAKREIEVDPAFAPWLLGLACGRPAEDALFAFKPVRDRKCQDERKAGRDALSRRVQALCVEAGVPVVVPHSLRGTNASLRRLGDASDLSIQKALGHVSIETTKRSYFAPGVQERADSRRTFGRLAPKAA